MKFLYIVLFVTLSSISFAQSFKQKQADKLYNTLAYTSAIELYKDLVKGKNPTEDNLRKLANSYYQIYDFKNSNTYYKLLLEKFNANFKEEDAINYFQTIKYLENYKDVESSLSVMKAKKESSLIVKNNKQYADYLKSIKNDSALYKIYSLDGINTPNSEFSPVFFRKKNYLMFASNRRNTSARNKTFAWDNSYFMDMYTITKKDSLHFASPVEMSKDVISLYHDGPACLSDNENTLFLTRTNYINKKLEKSDKQIVNLKLFIYKKDSTGKLDKGESFPYNSDEYSIGHAAITKAGNRVYFVSDMPGGYGQTDLWYSELVNNKWEKPVNLGPAINTEGREMFPYAFEDGTLFFSSDGRAGLGGLDMYFAVPEMDMYFEPQSLSYPLNTSADDFGMQLNSDLQTGYFSSNRAGGQGKDDIYYFRSKVPLFGVTLKGVVYDENTKDILPGARVFLLNEKGDVIDSTKASATGGYMFKIPDPSKKYKLGAKERSRYYDRVVPVNEIKVGENTQNIYLFPKYKLLGTITDAKTNAPLEGVKVTLINKFKDERKTYNTNAQGTFADLIKNKKVGDEIAFAVKLEKEGYIGVVQQYSIKLDTNTVIELAYKLQKLELKVDLAKVIDIKPIYFDLNKFNIRPDAALELDKIVAVMNENKNMTIELGSHTDCRSSAAYNMKLSDKRAKSSAEYIISKGIDRARIYGKGYGESKLINKCECEGSKIIPCTEEEHQTNRRTEFIIVKL